MSFFTRFVNNLVRNFTEPDKLAAEMGTKEVIDKVPEADRRFEIRDGNWITKPYEDKRTQAQKDKADRADARAAKERESAKKSVVTEVAEEEEETTTAPPATPVQTTQQTVAQLADTTVSAEAAGRERSEAEQDAQKDKKKGKKSGTIKTSAQGLLSTDTEGLRPSRSLIAAA
jgi:hypothetical protein